MNLRQKEMLQDLIDSKNNQIKELQQRINKAINYIYKNYGLLDKYQIEILEDILKGTSE